jgi:hydrogenase maturation protease
MNTIDTLVQTLLYEGYLLYPYRADAVKNRKRFTFGALFPPTYCENTSGAEASSLQTECLIESSLDAQLRVQVRFLRLVSREVSRLCDNPQATGGTSKCYVPVEALEVDDQLFQRWQEAVECKVAIPDLPLHQVQVAAYVQSFAFPASRDEESLTTKGAQLVGRIERRTGALTGSISLSADRLNAQLVKLRVQVANGTAFDEAACPDREAALVNALVCAHVILHVERGEFVSLLDPVESFRDAVDSCQQQGVWPVLVGQEQRRDTVLASPIILYDYPQIAPESAGDLCDGTEIDEILMLRIMTLTEDEKRAMRAVDDRAREILERTEIMPEEQFMKMHGAIRGLRPVPEKT